MHDQVPALIIAHSTVYEPMRKEAKGYVAGPLGEHHFENVSVEWLGAVKEALRPGVV